MNEKEEIIRVAFSERELSAIREGCLESYVVDRLRRAGVPVKGVLCHGGVERGTLSICSREDSPLTCYTWSSK